MSGYIRNKFSLNRQIHCACQQERRINVSMVDICLLKLMWVYCTELPGIEGNDLGDRQAVKATITSDLRLGKILSVEEFETLPAGAKPRTSHIRSPGGERHGVRRH